MNKKFTANLLVRSGIILFVYFAFTGCSKSFPKDDDFTPPFDINVTLKPVTVKAGYGSKASGFVKFRQDKDTARIIDLDTWVTGLTPRHAYLLQRAVNPITDPDCTSTAWLTLGKGLVAQAIHTDNKGDGHEDLFRNVTALARGTQFRIHFQIVDSATLTPVLTSDCDMYEVR